MRSSIVPRVGTKKRTKMYARGQHILSAYYKGVNVELEVAQEKAAQKAKDLSIQLGTQVAHYGNSEMTIYSAGKKTHTEEITNIEPDDLL